MKKILTGLVLATCATTASATTYNINAVLDGVDGGFGFSGFHFAGNTGNGDDAGDVDNDGNVMTGSALASFDTSTAVGTYNDVTGAFSLSVDLVGAAGSVNFSGDLNFVGGLLSPAGGLLAEFTSPSPLDYLVNTDIEFSAGQVCCSGANAPNSFDGILMSLWGHGAPASSGGQTPFATIADANLGLDLRLELTAVPVPAAVWLFGSGLLGLVGIARRKSA